MAEKSIIKGLAELSKAVNDLYSLRIELYKEQLGKFAKKLYLLNETVKSNPDRVYSDKEFLSYVYDFLHEHVGLIARSYLKSSDYKREDKRYMLFRSFATNCFDKISDLTPKIGELIRQKYEKPVISEVEAIEKIAPVKGSKLSKEVEEEKKTIEQNIKLLAEYLDKTPEKSSKDAKITEKDREIDYELRRNGSARKRELRKRLGLTFVLFFALFSFYFINSRTNMSGYSIMSAINLFPIFVIMLFFVICLTVYYLLKH
jgi:hypothetical protein